MNTAPPRPMAFALKVLTVSIVACVALLALGYWPTIRLAGPNAVPAMLAGCGVSFVASVLGSLPMVVAQQAPVEKRALAVLMSTAIRLLIAAAVMLSIVLSGWLDPAPFLVWVAVSYLWFLAVDTLFFVRWSALKEQMVK